MQRTCNFYCDVSPVLHNILLPWGNWKYYLHTAVSFFQVLMSRKYLELWKRYCLRVWFACSGKMCPFTFKNPVSCYWNTPWDFVNLFCLGNLSGNCGVNDTTCEVTDTCCNWIRPPEDKERCCGGEPPPPCESEEDQSEWCMSLLDPIFQDCLTVVDPDPYIQDCLTDTCISGNMSCWAFEQYVEECSFNGICVDWRNDTFCRECFHCLLKNGWWGGMGDIAQTFPWDEFP